MLAEFVHYSAMNTIKNWSKQMRDKAVSRQLKKRWHNEGEGTSLREFVRALVDNQDEMSPLVKEWFKHKKGSLNQKRSDKNIARIQLEKSATKLARSKNKSKGGGAKPKAEGKA